MLSIREIFMIIFIIIVLIIAGPPVWKALSGIIKALISLG